MTNQRNETSLFCVDSKQSHVHAPHKTLNETLAYPDMKELRIIIVIEEPTTLMLTCKYDKQAKP